MRNLIEKLNLKLYALVNREDGQDLVEYSLVITLVALGCVAGVNNVASAINTVFSNISNTLS
jgi:pilus assembly protein Flp/PilA